MRFHIMPFHYFGGIYRNAPFAFESVGSQVSGYTYPTYMPSTSHPLTRVQTDGFFYPRKKEGTVGAVLHFPGETQQGCTYPIYHIESSMEAKWAAIYFGLEMAKRCDQQFIGIESDSLSIVRHITCSQNDSSKNRRYDNNEKHYVGYYYQKIKDIASDLQWCGVRHIPSELNLVNKMV